MAYVAPSTVVAGQTYSAASHNIIVNDIIDHEDRLDTVQNAQYPARNVLVNGAMQFAQRGTSVSGITTSGYNTADRWKTDITTLGTWTQSVENDGPTGSGLAKSLKMLCTTADASPAAGDLLNVAQLLEGQTLQHIRKGTSSAQPLTLSFWVKSNVTGTYTAFLYDSDNNRSVSASYAISASATWEQKTITFPADTTGTLNNDNAQSLELYMCLAAGSNFTSGSLGTTWASYSAANRAAGQTNVASAINNYWQITGVQLEPGSQASPFEFVRYDDELRRCQRYYYMHANGNGLRISLAAAYSGTFVGGVIHLPVEMRIAPVSDCTSGTDYYTFFRNGAGDTFNSLSLASATTQRVVAWENSSEISSTAGHAGWANTNNASARVAFTAEL